MPREIQFIFDFDSTFARGEMLEQLAALVLTGAPEREATLARIAELTRAAMEGRMAYAESLRARLALIPARRVHLDALIAQVRGNVTPSFLNNRAFFIAHAAHIYVVSSGLRDVILPVAEDFGIPARHVFGNQLHFDAADRCTGVDEGNPLAQDDGKLAVVRALGLTGEVCMVGDGMSDYAVRKAGLATHFYAFTENVRREPVVAVADREAPSLDEVLYDLGLRAAVSYPKNRLKVLLLENIHADAVAAFEQEGYAVETVSGSLDEAALAERLAEVSILGLRSKTRLTEQALAGARRLLAVGAFCIGTNQIALEACARRGVAAFNAPFSNTRSVVELALAEIILLLRGMPEKIRLMDRGVWDKSAHGAHEVRGKRLGIVGYGNIGMQLSVLAEALGMEVCYYDVAERLALGNAVRCTTLTELLQTSDAVSVHVDGRRENNGLIGATQLAQMKSGAVFLNLSRGHVVDLEALRTELASGRLRGAALDVFPEEPQANGDAFVHPLRELPNALLTPHVGGSTLEAQQDIGRHVSKRIIDYVNSGNTEGSVNFPALRLPPQTEAHRLIHVHENLPGILAQINQALAAHG
ncbi:MAG TPA: phosphoglycerate dehydrogenase, partial [Gammaproteobacteria bacterium]|nr:phosphoglycerate dehydrogenase [Gammaproteobacteria bacterium]